MIEKKLHKQGVFHFFQVAAFTEEDIKSVNEVLDFAGRIEREEWVAQAAKLAQKNSLNR